MEKAGEEEERERRRRWRYTLTSMRLATDCYSIYRVQRHNRELYTQCHVPPTWYGDLLRDRCGRAVLVSDSDSDRVGP